MASSVKGLLPRESPVMENATSSRTPTSADKRVNFAPEKVEVEKKREKYLTAKYGAHQMSLIRKRLAVEMWMYERLQDLYGGSDECDVHYAEVDLDELLDMENDQQRRSFLRSILTNAREPLEVVDGFIMELLERAKSL